jgi:hypothetical protein
MSENLPFDWEGAGYDAFPDLDRKQVPQKLHFSDAWELLRAAITQARRGWFGLVRRLVHEVVVRTEDPVLHSVACAIVADAGSAAELEALVLALQVDPGVDRGLDIVNALAARGRLMDVPVLLRFYERHRTHSDMSVLPLMLNSLLARDDGDYLAEPADDDWEEYRKAIAERYFRLWNELGTNLIHVYHGRAFDLGVLIKEMRRDLRQGFLDPDDRHLFEVTTGLSCSNWYKQGEVRPLQVAAELEQFLESGKAKDYPVGQRLFMGHFIEDVGAAAAILATYPSSRRLDLPEIRTALDVDDYFALESGFAPFRGGYFIPATKPPPSAALTIDEKWPWLSLHTCLRAAIAGNRNPLEGLWALVNVQRTYSWTSAVSTLVADAADDRVVESLRARIRESEDPELTNTLCWALLGRGLLRDVPLVLDAYRRHVSHPWFPALQGRLNQLFAFQPVRHGPYKPMAFNVFCEQLERSIESLRQKLGREDVPIFRGELFSVEAVAHEIIGLHYGPDLTADLRQRFEASTGIDCTDWETSELFDQQKAAASAQRFLDSPAAANFNPGQLYFFGRPIQQ